MVEKISNDAEDVNNGKIEAVHLIKNYTLKEKTGLFKSKRKRTVQAVKDVTLEIPRGKIVGILGINGAGKTTIIRTLASVITPTSGTLTMNGVDAVKNHLWVKERINVISGGERNLYWRLTAIENLNYFGSLYGLSGTDLKNRIARLLKIVGLEEAADTPVERYSKGMKQRLQIARGLINNPEYIFLDEPTLGLDIVIAKEIRVLVSELARKSNKGVLLTTHYISEAEELCDYIYVLDKGQIIGEGTKEELKELFTHKPQLFVQVNNMNDVLFREVAEELGEDVKIELKEERMIKVLGDANIWTKVLNVLLKYQIQVTDLSINEPSLEDVLMKIIYQSRGKYHEKNSISS